MLCNFYDFLAVTLDNYQPEPIPTNSLFDARRNPQ